MKKFFTLTMLALLLSVTANAQSTLRKTWDFREGFSAKTVNALKADQEEFGADKYWRNYEGDATKADEQHFWCASKDAKNADGFAATHNGGTEKVISELEGLTLGFTAAKKFVITYNGATYPNEFESEGGPAIGEPIPHGNSYIWLNGKNETIKFHVAGDQTIKIGVESHAVNRTKLGEARGISLTTSSGSLELTKGNAIPTYYTECEWNLSGTNGDVAELTIKSTNGCHIYYIIVGEGDDPNANKKKVAYITGSDDASSEVAYKTLQAAGNYNLTTINGATLTADQLAAYDATVISPNLPADNAGVAVLKQAIAFYPIVNLNAALYPAWGYGESVMTEVPIALVTNLKSELVNGLETQEDTDGENILNIVQLTEASPLSAVKLGEYFAGDEAVIIDGNDPTIVATHIHNTYHNAYVFVTFADDANADGAKLLVNALDAAIGSKSEITKAPAPKVTLEYKNKNTNITMAMASSNLPKPHIYYTLDGTDPTEASAEYTDIVNVTSETTVKAVAIAEGYLLSDVTEANAQIFDQPATPDISATYEEGKTIVTLSCETPDVDIWYNFSGIANDTTKSMKYAEPITFTLPSDFIAYAVAGKQVYSEPASQRIVVKDVIVRQDQIGLFDANATDFQNGGGSTVYYFSWGKNPASIYDTTADPIGTNVDPDTGDETAVYPERDYEYYVPTTEDESVTYPWEVKSKGQVMIWQSLTTGSDPGNESGYNPETSGDILSYAKITNNDIQFGGKTSGEPCTGAIQSRVKFAGPFDIATVVGTAAGGENVGRMQIQVSKDSVEWTNVGEEMTTSTVKRLWKTHVRSYNETDEVYVRIIQAGGGSSVQIYNMYILNEGEKSLELKNQYNQEYEEAITGIQNIQNTTKAAMGIYNLNGMRQQNMVRGLNIVVNGDGTVKKVLVK